MKVGKYYVSACNDSGIERVDAQGDAVRCKGYYCQVYSDPAYKNQVDDFCLAVGYEIPDDSEESLKKGVFEYLGVKQTVLTEKRKIELIEKFLDWMSEHHENDEDLYYVLSERIGFSQEELHEFSIECLDEYYEREQEREEQETIDTITGEDVMEATAYMANAPDCCSAEEKAENVLGMLGANIIDESIYHTEDEHDAAVGETAEETETDYEKEVVESVETEYAEFKASVTDGKTPEEVFDEAYEIHVKTAIKDAVCEECLTPEIYKALYQKKGEILQTLYDGYQADPSASVTTNTDAEEFIERYCNQNYPEIMNGEDEEVEETPVPGIGG